MISILERPNSQMSNGDIASRFLLCLRVCLFSSTRIVARSTSSDSNRSRREYVAVEFG